MSNRTEAGIDSTDLPSGVCKENGARMATLDEKIDGAYSISRSRCRTPFLFPAIPSRTNSGGHFRYCFSQTCRLSKGPAGLVPLA